MKILKLSVAITLLIGIIALASCDKDKEDHLEYHLELSKNSCEVMQGRSVSIGLTAHENTTVEANNSDLIDVRYKWLSGSYQAQIEVKGKQKGETNIVVTDHETGESATIKVKVTEYPMPRLAVEHPKGNIYDVMTFYLYNEDSRPINSSDLSAVCDSIVWTVGGVKGSFRIFEHAKGEDWVSNHLTLKWEHCFKYPGEYETFLTAWKDNQKIFRHQLDLSVGDSKDFLSYNWSDITKDSQAWGSSIDVLKSSPGLMTTHGLNGAVPFVEARLFNKGIDQYQTFYDYFGKLYSAPTYEDKTSKHKMWELYDKLFSEQKEYPNAYPVAIWVTERVHIVLLLLDDAVEYPGYVVYAEPKRH